MAPLARPAAVFVALVCAAGAASAQGDERADILARVKALKDRAASSPRADPVLRPRSEVSDYLLRTGDARVFYPRGYAKAPEDDARKFASDADLAVKAYETLKGKRVTFADEQTFTSMDFFLRTGAAALNPNRAQTSALAASLGRLFAGGPVLQVDLIYEALKATDGNLTLAMGSLAELFCEHRSDYIPKVADMADFEGKNYYRYAGFFIGLHGWTTRALGAAASYANMAGNPVVYAGHEVYAWWRDTLSGAAPRPVDTLKTLGPQGHGDLVDKGGELHKGFDAAEALRAGR